MRTDLFSQEKETLWDRQLYSIEVNNVTATQIMAAVQSPLGILNTLLDALPVGVVKVSSSLLDMFQLKCMFQTGMGLRSGRAVAAPTSRIKIAKQESF